jgi:hypothetical protein
LEEQRVTQRNDLSAALPLPHAGFWIRLIAGILDLILLVIPFAVFVSFSAAAMGISNPFFNHRAGTPLNETLVQWGPTFLSLCVCFFAAESWLYFALSESSHWCATLGVVCSRRRRQARGLLASESAFLRRPPISARPCPRRLLFRLRLPLRRPDTRQARHPRHAFRLSGPARKQPQFICSLKARCRSRPPVRTVPAYGKMATPVPRESCTPFCEAPILAKIRGPAPDRARGVVFRGG